MSRAGQEQKFASEAELCAEFIKDVPKDYTAFAETGGWDILLVRGDGYQIGIEAKLRLNPHVVSQAIDSDRYSAEGPDFRAVLVPSYGAQSYLEGVCAYIGITIIQMSVARQWRVVRYWPYLPLATDHHYDSSERWFDWAPLRRHEIPEYVPDVIAGASGPSKLTDWKIRAIKAQVILERRGFITRADFKHLGLDHRRWLPSGGGWLSAADERGRWTKGRHLPDFRLQHPRNYAEIEADFDKWAPRPSAPPVITKQEALAI